MTNTAQKKGTTNDKDDTDSDISVDDNARSIVILSAIIISILILVFLLGFDLGTRLFLRYVKKVCTTKPAEAGEGHRLWDQRPDHGNYAVYLCRPFSSAKVYKMLKCNYETDEWEEIYKDTCACMDILPPVVGMMIRMPETEYTRKIGDKVTFNCTDDPDAGIMAEYVCNNNSLWTVQEVNECQCPDPPRFSYPNHLEVWPGESTQYGAVISYLCADSVESTPMKIFRCERNGTWDMIFERSCECEGVPNFDLDAGYLTNLEKREIGECIDLYCDLKNNLSALKYHICCGLNAAWELVVETSCDEKYYLFTKPLNYTDAKLDCQQKGGRIAYVRNQIENNELVELAKCYSHLCNYVYIGVEEDEGSTWLSIDGENIIFDINMDTKFDNADYMCLALQLVDETTFIIINVPCYRILCSLCSGSGEGFDEFNLILIDVKATFDVGQLLCFQKFAKLAPTSVLSSEALAKIIPSIRQKCNEGIFIGGRSWFRSWQLADGQKIEFLDFAPNEPNKYSEHCVVMSKYWNYKWLDTNCDIPFCYICQLTVPPVITNPQTLTHQMEFCPEKWLDYDGSCFLFKLELMNSSTAEESCVALDSNLLHVLSTAEQIFLTKHLIITYSSQIDQAHFYTGFRRSEAGNSVNSSWISGHEYNLDLFENKTSDDVINTTAEIYCGFLTFHPERWIIDDCNKSGFVICRKDYMCRTPNEGDRYSRRVWSGDRFPGATVNYTCSSSPYDATLRAGYVCNTKMSWEIFLNPSCELAYEAFSMSYTWDRASDICQKLSGRLATLENTNQYTGIKIAINHIIDQRHHCSKFYVGHQEDLTVRWLSQSCISPERGIEVPALSVDDLWAKGYPRRRVEKCVVISALKNFLLITENCNVAGCIVCEDNLWNYQVHSGHYTYTKGLEKCKSLQEHLATVRTSEQFWKLRDSVMSSVNSSTCYLFYLDIQSSNTTMKWIDNQIIIPELIDDNQNLINYIAPCIAQRFGGNWTLEGTDCTELNCFVCQIPFQFSLRLLPFVRQKEFVCPENFPHQFNDACFQLNLAEVDSDEAHVQCLRQGASSVFVLDSREFSFLANVLKKKTKSGNRLTGWHTGLYSVNSTVVWRSAQQKRLYPNIYSNVMESHCPLLLLTNGIKNDVSLKWRYIQSCERKANVICRHDPSFLGFRKLSFHRMLRSKKIELHRMDISSCAAACSTIGHPLMATMKLSSDDPCCVCAQDFEDRSLLLMSSVDRPQDYECHNAEPCPNLRGQICGCDGRAAVYLLDFPVPLGCYAINLPISSGKVDEKPFLDSYAEDYDYQDHGFPAVLSAEELQFRCHFYCSSKRYLFSGRQLTSDPSHHCFCFHWLPTVISPRSEKFCMSRSEAENEDKDEMEDVGFFRLRKRSWNQHKIYLFIHRLPDPNRV